MDYCLKIAVYISITWFTNSSEFYTGNAE